MDSISRDSGFSYQRFDGFDSAISEAICDNPYNEPTPLAACRVGDLSCLKRELQNDFAAVYKDYRSGKTGDMVSLLYVAVAERHVELARLLIGMEADVNYVTQDGWTALSYAADHGHVEQVRLLIDHKANVNQATADGSTPISYAAEEGSIEVVRLLIEHGAGVALANVYGSTPLSFAAEKGHAEVARLLIKHGANVNQAIKKGFTPLSLAAEQGHVELAQLLMENGADVNLANEKGATPLYFAAKHGNNKIVELLLANGANPNKKVERWRLGPISFTRSPLAASRRYHGNKKTVKMIKTAIALKKRKIVSSSEYTSLLAGQYASYGSIRQESIEPEKSLQILAGPVY